MTLLIHDVPISCINHAAATYHVPALMIISVLEAEGGKNGLESKNKDGTSDFGPMQVNSRWLPKVERYGITKDNLQNNPCINVSVGAWILGQSIAAGNNLWHGVGIYHSRTKIYNEKYKDKVKHLYSWLSYIIDPKTKPPYHKEGKPLVTLPR